MSIQIVVLYKKKVHVPIVSICTYFNKVKIGIKIHKQARHMTILLNDRRHNKRLLKFLN